MDTAVRQAQAVATSMSDYLTGITTSSGDFPQPLGINWTAVDYADFRIEVSNTDQWTPLGCIHLSPCWLYKLHGATQQWIGAFPAMESARNYVELVSGAILAIQYDEPGTGGTHIYRLVERTRPYLSG